MVSSHNITFLLVKVKDWGDIKKQVCLYIHTCNNSYITAQGKIGISEASEKNNLKTFDFWVTPEPQ